VSTNPLDGFWKVIAEVADERERQDAKFGECNDDDSDFHLHLSEEVGEVAQAISETKFGGPHAGTTRYELIHVAATAISFIQCIDRREKKP
jgi:NTP pyrophosphatase (non-canonical NTP hydrolase)